MLSCTVAKPFGGAKTLLGVTLSERLGSDLIGLFRFWMFTRWFVESALGGFWKRLKWQLQTKLGEWFERFDQREVRLGTLE